MNEPTSEKLGSRHADSIARRKVGESPISALQQACGKIDIKDSNRVLKAFAAETAGTNAPCEERQDHENRKESIRLE